MPRVLQASEIDLETEQEDAVLTAAEEEYEATRYRPTQNAPDLSDGGSVNGVRVRPNRDKSITQGRAVSRVAWMWNGTRSELPLSWDPDGRIHDGARRYFQKRYCRCCTFGGFRGRQCPACVKTGCIQCNGGQNRTKVIPCFYSTEAAVPYPSKRYGSINCFLPSCVRRDLRGFLTEEAMRLHARGSHTKEYEAHLEVLAASKTDEVEALRKRVDDLMSVVMRDHREEQPVTVAKAEVPKRPGRRWTPEQRKAASVRAKARMAS